MNIKDKIEYSQEGIVSKILNKGKTVDVTLFTMSKGSEIGEHTSIKEGVVYLVEGKLIFNLDGKDIKMVPGSIIFMKENQVHSLKADENSAFLLCLGGLR